MAGIVWWEIETPEPEAFQRFHAALSGWSFEPAFADTELGADYWIIQQDGRGIGGLQRAPSTASPPSAGTRVYLAVEDLETALEHVVELGGVVERSRIALGGDDRWFGVFRDPTGVSFGLWTEYPKRVLAQRDVSPRGAVHRRRNPRNWPRTRNPAGRWGGSIFCRRRDTRVRGSGIPAHEETQPLLGW